MAKTEGTSLNYFIGLAVAEKISRMQKNDSAASAPRLRLGQLSSQDQRND
jgi:hypothetical protein